MLNSGRVFMVMYNIEVERGGITSVMLNRSRALSDKGFDVSLVTLDDNPRYPEITRQLREIGRLSDDVDIINVYDEIRDSNTTKSMSNEQKNYYKKCSDLYEDGFQVQLEEVKTKKWARYFNNGVYVKYKKWDDYGNLSHIDYFDEQRNRIFREVFSIEGYVKRKIYFNKNTNKQHQVLNFTEDGFCYLNTWLNPETEKLQQHFLFTHNSDEVTSFRDNKSLHAHWLNSLCAKSVSRPFVLCDGIGSTHKILAMDSSVAHRIYPIHTNHFEKPYLIDSPIKESHSNLLNNFKEVESIVVLSEEQKRDLIKQYGNYDNVHVIPNSIVDKEIDLTTKGFSEDVSIVARYDEVKRLDHAILAFKRVIKKFPHAKLNLYGFGPDEGRLSKVISEHNLQGNVFIKGYSRDVASVYKNSIVTLLTSQYEGFGLVIAESMMYGTPVISYDIDYGPRDIISDGIDGFLVKSGDIKDLADKITYALENQSIILDMGKKAAKNVRDKFTNEIIVNKWLDLFTKLREKELLAK